MTGGYTRIILTGFRKGDGGEKAFIEILGSEKVVDEKREKRAELRAKRAEETRKAMEEAKAQAAEGGARAEGIDFTFPRPPPGLKRAEWRARTDMRTFGCAFLLEGR